MSALRSTGVSKSQLQRLLRKLMWRNKAGWVEGLLANFVKGVRGRDCLTPLVQHPINQKLHLHFRVAAGIASLIRFICRNLCVTLSRNAIALFAGCCRVACMLKLALRLSVLHLAYSQSKVAGKPLPWDAGLGLGNRAFCQISVSRKARSQADQTVSKDPLDQTQFASD